MGVLAWPQQLLAEQRETVRKPTDVQSWHLGSPTGETIEERLEAVDAVIVARIVTGPLSNLMAHV